MLHDSSKVENENNHNSTITNNKIFLSLNIERQRYSSPYNEWILWSCGQLLVEYI